MTVMKRTVDRESSQAMRSLWRVLVFAAIHVLCENDASLATATVDGVLAWAGILGGSTAFFSGLPAAIAIFIPSTPESVTRRINRGVGIGMLAGMALGPLTLFVFIARIVS